MVKRRTDKTTDEEGREAPDSTDPSADEASGAGDDAVSESTGDTKNTKKKAGSKKSGTKKRPEPESEAGDDELDASAARDDDEADESADDEPTEQESTDLEVAARDLAEDDDEDEDEELVLEAHQLGIQKYVLAAYFAAGMLGAYIFGRFLHTLWGYLAIRDWFSQALPDLAAIPEDTKLTYATVFSGVVALFTVIRCYRSDRIRGWVNDVAGELAKVKWPSKKETTNSTITVIATAAVAMTYLALLDRLWGFMSDLVYGSGA